METITSPDNKTIKETAALSEKKYRDKTGLFVIEGLKFVDEIPGNCEVCHYILSESFLGEYGAVRYEKRASVFVTSDKLFKKVSNEESPQGILAACKKMTYDIKDMIINKYAAGNGNKLIIILDGISDPGNVGTIVRTACASGASGVVLGTGCADLYNPKTLRAAAGAVLKMPVLTNAGTAEIIGKLNSLGYMNVAADVRADNLPYLLDFTQKCAIIIGNESRGLAPEIVALCSQSVKLPMTGYVESLNASVAAAVLIYEAVRQRIV